MPRFLSPQWVERFNEAASAAEVPEPGPEAGLAVRSGSFAMAQVVTDGPDGEVCTVLHVDGSKVSMEAGDDGSPPDGAEGADVTVRLVWEDAVALSAGTLRPAEALAEGRIRVRGDLSVLAAAQATLAAVQPHLAGLRADTTY